MALGTRMRKSQGGADKVFGRRSSDKNNSDENDNYENKFTRRSKDIELKTFGRESVNGNGRNFSRGGDFSRKRSPISYRGNIKSNENGYSGKCNRERSESRYSITKNNSYKCRGDGDFKTDGRNPYYETERRFSRENSNDDRRSTRELRGDQNFSRGGYDDGKSKTRDPRSFRGRRGVIIPNRSPVIDQLMSKVNNKKRKNTDDNNLEERIVGRPMRIMRRDRVSKHKEENDENSDAVEASSDKLRLKWKKMDKKQKDSDVYVNDQDKVDVLKKTTKNNDGGDSTVEDKPIVRRTRILDRFGKKIRVVKTSLKDGSETTIVPVKKKKRAIKLDPYDLSNKRLDDVAPVNAKNEDKDTDEISMNAQFRAIQPSPSFLSFVEDNLLGRRRLTELKDAGYNVKLSAPLDNIPFSTNIERERIEENVFRSKLEFFAAAKIASSFPPPIVPEIAFAGRSNIGKSSLLNALTRQWGVVRTSDKPGLTQTINFFDLDKKLALVDLPGYGFAYAKEEVKEAWEELVKEYVSTRVGLQRVCLLIDTKWGMKPRDRELIDLMERSKTPYQIVLTKTDLVFPIDVARRAMQIEENLKRNKSIINPLAMVSSKSGAGIRNLRSILAKITRFVKP